MSIIKMNNKVRRIVGAILILIGIMMKIGVTANAVYETEEVPAALILELVEVGFKPSEDDEDIWIFDGYYSDDDMMYFAYFNVAENCGAIYGERPDGKERSIVAFRWDGIYGEFEDLGGGYIDE